jgi:hypothetical protein
MEKPIFFSDHLKKCIIDANKKHIDRDEILSELYQIGAERALEIAMAQGKGIVYKDDFLFEADKIGNMFNMLSVDKELRGYVLPPLNWFKVAIRKRLAELENNKQ